MDDDARRTVLGVSTLAADLRDFKAESNNKRVEQSFAVQAGREIRVVADAKQVNDREAAKMCRDIAKAIEETLTYPGEIKVTVLRETRTIKFAK